MNKMILVLNDQENEKVIREVLNGIAEDLLLEIKYLQFKDSELCSLNREDLVKLLLNKKVREEYFVQPKTLAELKSKDVTVRAISNETEVIVEADSIGKGVFPDGEPEGLYNERGWITVATLPLSPGVMKDMMNVMSNYLKLAA